MTRTLLLSVLALLAVSAAHAAESWGLPDERAATISGTVVDVQCALTGDCPRDCGGGRRQLGLLGADRTLVLVMKSLTPFAGAVRDLLPFCGRSVMADGLFATSQGSRVFAVQRLKPSGGAWIAADRFASDWAAANKVRPGDGRIAEWYRHDPDVARLLAADGKLGLGAGVLPKE